MISVQEAYDRVQRMYPRADAAGNPATERAAEARGEVLVPETWLPGDVRPSVCAPGCCPNLRAAKPALCGSD